MQPPDGDTRIETNRRYWDERVPLHVASDFYDLEGFRAGRDPLRAFEIEELGDVAGKSLLHLQCHFGLDTLAWARRGAHVVGLDFSAPAIEAARDVAATLDIPAEFVEADVYDAPRVLAGRRFDIVYTGLGALIWLPDIRRWADVVAAMLNPGGRLHLSEFHPITDVFADGDLEVARDYFRPDPATYDEPGSYVDLSASTTHNVTFEWSHTLGDTVTAIVEAGLLLEFLHEHDHTLWPRWPFLERREADATYRMPSGRPSLPLMYSLAARKPPA